MQDTQKILKQIDRQIKVITALTAVLFTINYFIETIGSIIMWTLLAVLFIPLSMFFMLLFVLRFFEILVFQLPGEIVCAMVGMDRTVKIKYH